ncbi:MAG TPA: tetratricopeptide repeat protein [Alphaproteobacteria bacterium]|nr:tetratricopeptide repeat protein [Alphaproteobacteria bacterium]
MAVAPLKLQVLGGFRLWRADGSSVDTLGRKEQALLVYLALHDGRPQTRDRLANILWSDRGEPQARHSLRQSLTALRRELPDPDGAIVVADQETIALHSGTIEVDLAQFIRAATQLPERPDEAARLFVGDLLEGLDVRSDEFDNWLTTERSRLHNVAATVFARLGAFRLAEHDHDAAIAAAQQLLNLDPVDEGGHRLLMRCYAATGRRSAALRQFNICADLLVRHFNTAPSGDTVRLYEAIRDEVTDLTMSPARSSGAAPTATAGNAGALDPTLPSPTIAIGSVEPVFARTSNAPPTIGKPRKLFYMAVAAALLIAAGVWRWFEDIDLIFFQPSSIAQTIDSAFRRKADIGRMRHPLPDKPSIVVLPFENLSSDPAQEVLVDAVSEGITVVMASVAELFVIDRSSALSFKGRSLRVKDVAEELGVRYVLEGSVQSSRERVRVSARLIDALSGDTLWADRFDPIATDIFKTLDGITLRIVTAVHASINEGEQERIAFAHGTRNLDAWLAATQGLHLLRKLTRADTARARELYTRALEADPDYAGAWDGLGWTYFLDAWQGWSAADEAMGKALENAQRAIAINPTRGRPYALLGAVTMMSRDRDAAIVYFERARTYSPGDAEAAALIAYALTYMGDLDGAEASINQAIRLSPNAPAWYHWTLARVRRLQGRAPLAIDILERKLRGFPESIAPRIELALAYTEVGRRQDARAMAAEILRINPRYIVATWANAQPYADQGIVRREMESLRLAGFPG